MLDNDPPPGTNVRFTKDVRTPLRTAKALSTAKLVRAIGVYREDRPGDQFEVEYLGERITVRRDDIEWAP